MSQQALPQPTFQMGSRCPGRQRQISGGDGERERERALPLIRFWIFLQVRLRQRQDRRRNLDFRRWDDEFGHDRAGQAR